MPLYLDVLIFLNFLVDFFLLIATNRLSGYPNGAKRAALAAVLGGLYGGACILPGLVWLGGTFIRVAVLFAMGCIAFGIRKDAVRRSILFVLLSMALGGVAVGLENGFWTLILCAGAVCGLCLLGFRGRIGAEYIPVTIHDKSGEHHLTALRDTGNTLTDPLTGQQILVVSAKVGTKLTGLSPGELAEPTIAVVRSPGLRLVPFHSVGKSGGLLAAKRYEDVTVGRWRGSCLVAFAPNEIGQGRPYDALTGGVI